MVFYPQERLGLFIDGSNLYAAARALGFDIDYKKLLDVFRKNSQLIRAFVPALQSFLQTQSKPRLSASKSKCGVGWL